MKKIILGVVLFSALGTGVVEAKNGWAATKLAGAVACAKKRPVSFSLATVTGIAVIAGIIYYLNNPGE